MIQKELPSVAALAFLGDAVHSRYVRERLVRGGLSHARELNAAAQCYVTATAQAEALARIQDCLTEDEQDVCRRAHNTPHINRPKNVSGQTYRDATALEAVLGMLAYLGDEARLCQLLDAACRDLPVQGEPKQPV